MTKVKYFPGDRIGPLNILLKKRDKNNTKKGIFVCPFCGKDFIATISNIKTGNTKSCGCSTNIFISNKLNKNIAGQRFGNLTALYSLKRKDGGGHTFWRCLCDCGKECDVTINNLTTGNTKSCGDIKNCEFAYKNAGKRAIDITGQRFGKLVAIKEKYRKDKQVYWECLCDCGNTTIKSVRQLKSWGVQSCGCLKSKGEENIIKFLQSKNINFVTQKKFNSCKNPQTNYLLIFDFYLPDYNMCIEYNGLQHYEETGGWSNIITLKSQQYRDSIKYNWCKDNDIRLECIKYNEDIEDKLEEILNLAV